MPRKPKTPPPLTQAIGYVRVSTDDQQLSVEAQTGAIEAWCVQQHFPPPDIYTDIDVSGGVKDDADPLAHRPGLLDAISAVGPGTAFVATRRDRLARDSFAAAVIVRLVTKAGGEVQTLDGATNGNSPEQVLLRTILDAFAAYELSVIRLRTRTGMARKKARGERTSGIAPYGYDFDVKKERLIANPGEQEIIALARAIRAEGKGYKAIATRLAAEGHLSRANKKFHATAIAAMLNE